MAETSTMKNRQSMFMFGMRCVRCDHEIIAPHTTELLDDKIIRHLWHCPNCKARFESFPRFPANAKSVRDVMFSVDVFPPLSGT
jgi:transcription elongation factor Elf1